METPSDDIKIMIFYLLSGEEIHRINIIRDETTIKDIRDSINDMKCKMISSDFDINRAQLTYFNSLQIISTDFDIKCAQLKYFNWRSYAWNLILKNENILRVYIIVIETYLHISNIDVYKIIFNNPEIEEYYQTINVNYEGKEGLLTFYTSKNETFEQQSRTDCLEITLNEEDSVSLIKLNEHLRSSKFKTIFGNAMDKFKLINIIQRDDKFIFNRIKVYIKYDRNEYNRTQIYQGLYGDEIRYNTIDDFYSIVKYGGTYVFLITVSRIWANKPIIKTPVYGIEFQLRKVFIIKN